MFFLIVILNKLIVKTVILNNLGKKKPALPLRVGGHHRHLRPARRCVGHNQITCYYKSRGLSIAKLFVLIFSNSSVDRTSSGEILTHRQIKSMKFIILNKRRGIANAQKGVC